MYEVWINKVVLLYLPSHLTHLLQPLDVAIFSSLKSHYHGETAEWVSYDITAPMAKQMFLEAYVKASYKAFSQHNMQKGFSTTGIVPLNRNKPLSKEGAFVNTEGEEHLPRAETPEPRRPRTLTKDLSTPQKSQDIRKQTRVLRKRLDEVDKAHIKLVFLAGKALDTRNATIAVLQT
jgi:hypothetical protein